MSAAEGKLTVKDLHPTGKKNLFRHTPWRQALKIVSQLQFEHGAGREEVKFVIQFEFDLDLLQRNTLTPGIGDLPFDFGLPAGKFLQEPVARSEEYTGPFP